MGCSSDPHLPGSDDADRTVWRTALEPPFDVSQFPSPLAGFRKYTEPNASELFDKTLFEVSGLPEGTPVRLATLDTFDGSVWGAGNVAAGVDGGRRDRRGRVRRRRDVPPGRQPHRRQRARPRGDGDGPDRPRTATPTSGSRLPVS